MRIYHQARFSNDGLMLPAGCGCVVAVSGGRDSMLLLAILTFYRTLQARRKRIEDRPLTDAERAEAERLLAQASDNKTSS